MKTLKQIYMTFLLLVLSLSIGCQKSNIFQSPCVEAEQIRDPAPMEDTRLYGKWIFESFQKAGSGLLDKEIPPAPFREMWLAISDTIIAFLTPVNSCGIHMNKFHVYQNNIISIENFYCTEAGGSKQQIDWEEKMQFALKNATCYYVNQKKFILYYQKTKSWHQMNFYKEQ